MPAAGRSTNDTCTDPVCCYLCIDAAAAAVPPVGGTCLLYTSLCFLLVDFHAELFQMSLGGALDLIEGKVGILFRMSISVPLAGYHATPPEMLIRSSLPLGRMATLFCMALLRVRTVSYTHLDVYKRQA